MMEAPLFVDVPVGDLLWGYEVSSRRFYKRRKDVVFAIYEYMAIVQCTSMELNPLPIAPLVFKFGIHLGKAGRKGVRGGEEEGWSGG
jgi:hypothetical protein